MTHFPLAALLLTAIAATATPISDADIEAAIREGLNARTLAGAFVGSDATGQYRVSLQGPRNRVANAARAAAQAYKPFTRADVAAHDAADLLRVVVLPGPPRVSRYASGLRVTPAPTHIVLQSKGARTPATAVHPQSLEFFPQTWKNAVGGEIEGKGATAHFAPAAVPPGPFDVVVVSSAGERRYAVAGKDRAKIR